MHFERVLAPAERKTDIALFFPENDFLIGARTVAEKRLGRSFAGIKSLCEIPKRGIYSRIRLSGFLTVCSR
jgi:hypothetical protein